MMAEFCLLVGFLAVASNPSPYYAALGLVWSSGIGCFVLAKGGVSFLSLVLFLVYLGGMMVVFAYCAALVAEPHPEAWGSRAVLVYLGLYSFLLLALLGMYKQYWGVKFLSSMIGWEVVSGEWWGTGGLFCSGGWALFLGGWALLLTLFVALEVVRGSECSGSLRAV